MSAENRALALSHDMPPLVKGMDEIALGEFLHMLSATGEFGYDPETDYRKSPLNSLVSTFRHPDVMKYVSRLI